MNWLAAHDGNNDGLLEIPEAGDWTDLFGRSYNVLYDEVLWFAPTSAMAACSVTKANSPGRRLITLRSDRQAEPSVAALTQRFLAQHPAPLWRRAALSFFCRPSVRPLGDTQYLLAEITPFSFNWRCDVLGNLLAFLVNLLDVTRARTALRFMWGVGVNNPWPVASLYPVVTGRRPRLADLLHRQPAQPAPSLSQRRHLALHRRVVGAVHPSPRLPRNRQP